MAAIDDLIAQISDDDLRRRIAVEVGRLIKNKKFGLVFEDHLPEDVTDAPIYPYLQRLGEVRHGRDDDPWHTLIEADNYYALRLLAYVYPGQVDCIYIDPPYNTGARDWKYNNDYVDSSDRYRHSKWLSMMKRRLLLAKKLLNPNDSVLICTIDEKEYLHLGCLLEELFPEAHMQMVSIVINPNGVARDHEMYRVEEYAFFIYFGKAGPVLLDDPLFTSDVNQKKDREAGEISRSRRKIRWEWLMRGGSNSDRPRSPGCFYPIFIDPLNHRIVDIGNPLPNGIPRESIPNRPGLITCWPIAVGTKKEKVWRTTPENLRKLLAHGFAKLGAYDKRNDHWGFLYLGKKQRERIERGEIIIKGRDNNGAVIVEEAENQVIRRFPKTIWNRQAHNAGEYGSRLIRAILPGHDFPFPKSVYAVRDTLRCIIQDKPNALILDFFAGSGTTLHAVNLLNAEDGGHRRCIMVTNNEVSDGEAKILTKQGLKRGDEAWERLGIARYVCWPRTVCSIEGHDINGHPLKGEYLGDRHLQMKDGFAANAVFFKLGFLNKNAVALGRQFRELLPMLWMKAGSRGPVPTVEGNEVPPMLVMPQNAMAILTDEKSFDAFAAQVNSNPDIKTVYLVVDGEATYRAMAQSFAGRKTCQLYRDYLDNFRINPSTL